MNDRFTAHLRNRLGEPAPSQTPLEALRELLRDLKALPTQGQWDGALEDEGLQRKLLETPWQFSGMRIRTKGRICRDCMAANGAYVGTPECVQTRWSVNVPLTVERGAFVPQTDACPLLAAERKREDRYQFLEDLNISVDKQASWTFETLANLEGNTELMRAVDLCREYIEDHDDHWLYLYSGKHGTGKTRLAVATGLMWAERGLPVRLANFPLLYATYKGGLGAERGENEADMLHMMAHTILPEIADFKGLLILDDVGKEIVTPRTLEWLYIILDRRSMLNLPLLLTTNYGLRTLVDRYSGTDPYTADAIGSRIAGRIGLENLKKGVTWADTYRICLDRQPDYRRYFAVSQKTGVGFSRAASDKDRDGAEDGGEF